MHINRNSAVLIVLMISVFIVVLFLPIKNMRKEDTVSSAGIASSLVNTTQEDQVEEEKEEDNSVDGPVVVVDPIENNQSGSEDEYSESVTKSNQFSNKGGQTERTKENTLSNIESDIQSETGDYQTVKGGKKDTNKDGKENSNESVQVEIIHENGEESDDSVKNTPEGDRESITVETPIIPIDK